MVEKQLRKSLPNVFANILTRKLFGGFFKFLTELVGAFGATGETDHGHRLGHVSGPGTLAGNARVYDGNGNRRVNSRTFPRIRSSAALSSRFCSASATRSAISSISSSRIPRVVTAGVPTRIPPGLKMG